MMSRLFGGGGDSSPPPVAPVAAAVAQATPKPEPMPLRGQPSGARYAADDLGLTDNEADTLGRGRRRAATKALLG